MSYNFFNVNFPDAVFDLWKKEEGKSTAGPPLFAMNILERLGHISHWTESLSLLDEATSSIKELDAFQKFLKSHLNSIQETVDALRGAVRPFMFGKGIDALPDEILSTIFEFCETERYNTVTQTCSLVSRRFRRVILNTPRLWCTVSISMASMDCVIRSLERSKSLGLNVRLDQEGAQLYYSSRKVLLDFSEFLDAVLAHSERWESFKCDLDISAQAAPTDMREHLKRLTYLPSLKVIKIHRDDEMDGFAEDPIFLRSLRAPQLQRMLINNCLPGPSALFLTLTSLDIEVWNCEEPQFLHRLYTLLVSIPTLAEVSLFLDCNDTLSASDGQFPPFVLQKLKTLKLAIRTIICDQLLSFRKALITPAIVDCSFSARDLDFGEFTTLAWSVGSHGKLLSNFLEFMLCHDEYPTLEALSIDFEPIRGRLVGFKIPFEKVPNLRELTLDIPGFYPLSNYSERIPALRSLTVRHLRTDAWIWVKGLWSTLRMQGDLPGLQTLVVDEHAVSQEWVKKCFSDNIL